MTPKNLWIQNVVESLKQIASEEFQIKGWVKNEIHDYCTFLETKCGFLMDDDIEGFLEHAKEFGLSEILFLSLRIQNGIVYVILQKRLLSLWVLPVI
jgi:hypothetical protein